MPATPKFPPGSSAPGRVSFRGIPALLLIAALLGPLFLAGCSTLFRPGSDTRHALSSIPSVPCEHLRADRAILAAFFDASGVPIPREEIEQIIPTGTPRGFMDRNAFRRIARQHNRSLTVISADEPFLWHELEINRPLLLLLPRGTTYTASVTAHIPIAWDRDADTLDLLDGNGEILTLPAHDFFSRRRPLKQAALCLVRPGPRGSPPPRESKLLLADFWFDQGFYRRTDVSYSPVQTSDLPDETIETLVAKGNLALRRGRYKDAIAAFRAALALEPDDPHILNNLAYAMLHGNDLLLPALRHANKALLLEPANPLILETVGSINLRLGDGPAAVRHLQQAWAYSRQRPPDIQIAIMDQLTRAWLACHREDRAWQVAEHRHQSFPEYRFPNDLLQYFPALRRPLEPPPPPP